MSTKEISPAILTEAERQHAILSRGVEQILGGEKDKKDGLFWKLVKSLETETPLKVKFGMDPTASDLHLGHTVVLTKLRQFQDLGHIAQPLIGDGTTLIGDPSGRNSTRPLLTLAGIRENAQTYLAQINKVLDTENNYDLRWNGDWLLKLNFQDVVELCSQVTVARIIEREDFAKRLKEQQPISLHELLYPLMQGYDSIPMQCDIELGGTDQTFNLLMGRMLMEKRGMNPQIAMTLPLLEGTDGVEKMSKSKDNYIGVTEDAAHMFGKTMSIPDDIMGRWFDLLTDVQPNDRPEHPMDAKKLLGRILVARFYDEASAQDAQTAFESRFSKQEMPEDLPELTVSAPDGTIGILTLMVEIGFAKSNSEARRLIGEKCVWTGETRIDDPKTTFAVGQTFPLKVGKLKWAILTIKS